MISSAISGRVDHLRGLKENVIIGRKIPVGTGIESLAEYTGAEEETEAEESKAETSTERAAEE